MPKHYWHKGECGDIIYSWMLLKQGAPCIYTTLWNSEHGFLKHAALARLAALQPYIAEFRGSDTMPCDAINLRHPIDNPLTGAHPTIIRPYFDHFAPSKPFPPYAPWLTPPTERLVDEYSVINVTARYRDPEFRWGPHMPAGRIHFLGLRQEYIEFDRHLRESGYADAANRMHYIPTADLYEAAIQIWNARAFFGNASCCLAIAQGLGVRDIFLELTSLTHTTCRFGHEKWLNEPPQTT